MPGIKKVLEDKGLNINTLIVTVGGMLTVAGGAWAVATFLVPLQGLPEEFGVMRNNQIVMNESVKMIAEIMKDTKVNQGQLIKHEHQLQEIFRRLDRIDHSK